MRRVREAGYGCAFAGTGITSFGTPLMRLRRLQVEGDHDLSAFKQLLANPGFHLRSRIHDIVLGYRIRG